MTKTMTKVEQIKEMLNGLTREELIQVEVAARSEMIEHEPSEYEARMIGLAIDEHCEDGKVEIDECSAVVSESSDNGAYVMAWVWVRDTHCECEECGEEYEDGGDGYDGLCPSCADKSEGA